MTTWIAVCNRTEARVFQTNHRDGKDLKLITKLENPRGRLKNQDINADKPGSSMGTKFSYPVQMTNTQEPTERVAQIFAKDISQVLEKGRVDHAYDDLVLVGEPHFLGIIRSSLSRPTYNTVKRTLRKDLVNVPDHQLHEYLF
jgi:protein required for attachment to host cells